MAGQRARAGECDRARSGAFVGPDYRIGFTAWSSDGPQLFEQPAGTQPGCIAFRYYRGHRATDHYRQAGAVQLEPDGSGGTVPDPAFDAQPEDQAAQYRNQEA